MLRPPNLNCTRKGCAEKPCVAAIMTATETTPEPLYDATATVLICLHEKQSPLLAYNDM